MNDHATQFIPRAGGLDPKQIEEVEIFIVIKATELSRFVERNGPLQFIPGEFYADMDEQFKLRFGGVPCDGTESPWGINREVLRRAHVIAGVLIPDEHIPTITDAVENPLKPSELELVLDALEAINACIPLSNVDRAECYRKICKALIAAAQLIAKEY